MIIFAPELIRKGYFYNTAKAEVDFYVPNQGLTIQVSLQPCKGIQPERNSRTFATGFRHV